jgi:subtilase family serine protease
MAPGANVLYVAGASCDDPDLLAALHWIISKRRADIITNSWGDIGEDTPPDVLQAYHQTFLQAAIEGIGVFFSSGDDGDDSLDTADGSPAVDFPSTEPFVTAVGGTSLGVDQHNGYSFETGWATGTSDLSDDARSWNPADFLYGGGGGVSSLFKQPFYQRGTVPGSIANGHRATPDIAMDGDPQTGMLVGESQTYLDGHVAYGEYRIGGTSLSSPLYAGIEALADQAAGRPHGFANPAIYQLAGSRSLHDVRGPAPVPAVVRVNYNNGENAADGATAILRLLDDEAQSLHVKPGWDNLTGVGTPNGAGFVNGLP